MSGFSQLSPVRGPPELKLAKLEKPGLASVVLVALPCRRSLRRVGGNQLVRIESSLRSHAANSKEWNGNGN